MHYWIYQKDQNVRFEIKLKHRQTKLVQDYLFQNQLDVFEHELAIPYFQYSERVVCLDSIYTDWSVGFQIKHQSNPTSRSLVTSYFENQMIKDQLVSENQLKILQQLNKID